MKVNRQADMQPLDMGALPKRQNPFLLPLIWGVSLLSVRGSHLKIDKTAVSALQPPYVVLSMHQGFTDYYITPLALFPHRASYISDMEGFANYGKHLYGAVGCIPTRRFVNNVPLVRNIRHVVGHNRDIIVIFPEARHSNVGTNSQLPPSIGKLVKLLGLPVVIQKIHGSYLTLPIWDEKNPRRAPLETTLEQILTAEDTALLSASALTAHINRHFEYDEYRWQYENRIEISHPARARGLHKVLYQCPRCGAEYRMGSEGAHLFCTACQERWLMDEYGRLTAENGPTEFAHIPDWYEHQRAGVETLIKEGRYGLEEEISIEALPSEKGFVPLGPGVLKHDEKGFTLVAESRGETWFFPTGTLPSVHTEYDYRGKGDSLVLSTKDCCYYYFGGQIPGEHDIMLTWKK